MSGLPFSIPFLSRSILMITDDGVSLHSCKNGGVKFVGEVSWRAENFETRVNDILEATKGASVTVLNDAVEQHYRKERVAVATAMDRKNIVQRRLNVSFPNYSMRAAMPLKSGMESKSAGKDAPKGDAYLFAAVPATESYSRLVKSLSLADMSVSGYGLLPVESVSLVSALSDKLSQRWGGTSGAVWSIVVGQHHGGGLRQIVVRGNELALTRVTPIDVPNPDAPEVWAGDVSQELQATLSYLSRFGYVPEDGVNIIVLGDQRYAPLLEDLVNVPCNFEAVTPVDAANLLGIRLLNQVEYEHFADGIHAGWAAKKSSLVLPLTSKELSSIANPRKMAAAAMAVLNIVFAGVLFLATDEMLGIYKASRNFDVAELQKAEIEKIYQEEVKRKERMGIDVNLIKSALALNGKLNAHAVDVLSLIEDVSRSLGTLRLDGFDFKNEVDEIADTTSTSESSGGSSGKNEKPISMILKFSFSGSINPKDGNADMETLKNALNARIDGKGFVAVVSKQLEDLSFHGEIVKEVGLTANQRSSNDRFQAEITITKKVVK